MFTYFLCTKTSPSVSCHCCLPPVFVEPVDRDDKEQTVESQGGQNGDVEIVLKKTMTLIKQLALV